MVSALVNPTFSTVSDLHRFTMDLATGKSESQASQSDYGCILSEYLKIWPDNFSAQATVEALSTLAAEKGRDLFNPSSRFELSGGVAEPDPSIDPELMTPKALSAKLSEICGMLGVAALPMPREIAPTMTLFEPTS